jgi:hypothetical protein
MLVCLLFHPLLIRRNVLEYRETVRNILKISLSSLSNRKYIEYSGHMARQADRACLFDDNYQ